MGAQQLEGSKRFGQYLRRLREGRKLSLDAVAEMSTQFPEKITKSHLSRLENGRAIPSFTRLYTLSRIYGVPAGSMAEQLEVALEMEQGPPALESLSDEEALERSKAFIHAGRYGEALRLCHAALDRAEEKGRGQEMTAVDLRLHAIDCLIRMGHYLLAREEAEQLLARQNLDSERRLLVLHSFIIICRRLGRLSVASMALREAEAALGSLDSPRRLRADITAQLGAVREATGEFLLACEAFKKAAQLYESIHEPLEACRARINLAQSLIGAGLTNDARITVLAALKDAEANGYERLQALGLSHLAVIAYSMRRLEEAEAYALRSNVLARPREYLSLVFRNCYYLWKIAMDRKDDGSRRLNEKTLRTYIGRLTEDLEEARNFRAYLAGGEA